jgi:3-hydroxyanthranilate 3,4-dioxygenase
MSTIGPSRGVIAHKHGPLLDFQRRLDEHGEAFKPPAGTRQMGQGADFMVTGVGGPNGRHDFHESPSEEFLHQFKGQAHLRLWDRGRYERVDLKEGDIFLMPPHALHSPRRPEACSPARAEVDRAARMNLRGALELSVTDRARILAGNARRFFGLHDAAALPA